MYLIFSELGENPIVAIVIIALVYATIDRWYIGALPDFIKPLTRRRKIAMLKRQVEYGPSLGQNFYELGALQVEKGDMKEGRKNLERANDLMPEHPDIEYYLGVACIKLEALEVGKTMLESALAINPKIKYGFPYVYLLEYSLKSKEPLEQIQVYLDKIVEYGNPQIYYEAGVVFQKEGYKEKAQEMFRKVQVSFKSSPVFLRKQQRYYVIMSRIRALL